MTRAKPADTIQARRVRQSTPVDLNRVVADIRALWMAKSGMDLTVIAREIGVSRGSLYDWFAGKGNPPLLVMDAFLATFGYHIEVAEDTGDAAHRRREATRADDSRRRVAESRRIRVLEPGVHPLMVDINTVLNNLDVNRSRLCDEIGISRGPMNAWFKPGATPLLIPLDNALHRIGYRFKIVRGLRPRRAVSQQS